MHKTHCMEKQERALQPLGNQPDLFCGEKMDTENSQESGSYMNKRLCCFTREDGVATLAQEITLLAIYTGRANMGCPLLMPPVPLHFPFSTEASN